MMKLTTIALLVGIVTGLFPWLYIDEPSWGWYLVSLAGGVLVAIAGFDSQAKLLGMQEPGEDLLRSWAKWLQKRIRGKS